MINILPLSALCAVYLMVPQAVLPKKETVDRFYFGSPHVERKMADGTADFIEGILMREEKGMYWIRVEGGEIRVPESMIYKIETTETPLARLLEQEDETRQRANEANGQRRKVLSVEPYQDPDDDDDACGECLGHVHAGFHHAKLLAPGGYNAILHTAVPAVWTPGAPVTPHRVDRGLSRYIEAREHRRRTGH